MGKLSFLFAFVLVLSTSARSQEHYLISPDEEVVRLEPGNDASTFIGEIRDLNRNAIPNVCWEDGWIIIDPPLLNVLFNARHKDVMAQWYVAPTSGTIDTIFFTTGQIGDWLSDSTVYVRVHRSKINPQYGPGVRPGPFDPPCQQWGYWLNTNDPDQGIAAFPELATDTTWISTYPGPGTPSTPPIGELIWGTAGGYPVRLNPGGLNMVSMDDLGPLEVSPGDFLFISVELSSDIPGLPGEEIPTQFYASEWTVSTADYDYPSRNWKFYEHDKGPSICSSLPVDSIKRGWIARGSITGDSLDVMKWDMWYTMTPAGNLPPIVLDYSHLGNTFDSTARVLQAVIDDCWPGNPSRAGVASAAIEYEVDGAAQPPVAMMYLGSDVWQGPLPGQPAGSTVSYRIAATDSDGVSARGPTGWYTVYPFGTSWYHIDTTIACTTKNISGTGTEIAAGAFFEPGASGTSPEAWADGTAGPIDIGKDFTLFWRDYRYAWIGVDGVVALSASPLDTINLNPDGKFDPGWTIPRPAASHFCEDTQEGCPVYPKMMIAPFRANHILADSSATFGHVYYGNGGDTCLFVVQWDSIGYTDETGNHHDAATFRVILNSCTGTVEFQYDDVGTLGQELAALSGIVADTSPAWESIDRYLFLNEKGFPAETRPTGNSCVRMYPKIGGTVHDGWNLMSVSAAPLDGDYSVGSLFPDLVGSAWFFDAGYRKADSLLPGHGYWTKFTGETPVGTSPATFIPCITVQVKDGWNLIGGPSGEVPRGSIIAAGGTSVISDFFGYGVPGYSVATSFLAGRAYWVKVSGAGTLTLCRP